MLTLDVRRMDWAKYVESHIGRVKSIPCYRQDILAYCSGCADLEGFVCEDPDDVNLLTKELRENLRLRKINAFHSSPDPPGMFRHPYTR